MLILFTCAAISREAARSGRPASVGEEEEGQAASRTRRASLPLLVSVALDMRRDADVQGLFIMLLLSGMLSLVLCSALAGIQHREAAQRERRHEAACIYKVIRVLTPMEHHIANHDLKAAPVNDCKRAAACRSPRKIV
ncbi:hypothetical protein HPB50_015957 [Hyalomma asiaticum]|uniref:Uncharacterized protein n=1 Tax=Hyalomma asiaticum TaxID=266040 RepID=A0ACB7TIJ3_HYAAI|nr:hypothetical protein HPB50_015957 [Hyalomma asiaticum]